MDFFTVFLLIMMLQPVIKQKMLEASRLRKMARLEKSRGTRVIALIHRQETMGFLGFPIFRYIDIDDSEAVLRAIKLTDADVPIDLILHTPGGLVLAAEQIAHAVQRHKAKVTVIVPHYAMSGGTLIALAADEILMDDNAVLGPVDPQLGPQPAASILKVLERKPIDKVKDDTIVMADLSEKSIRQVKTSVTKLLSDRMSAPQAERTAELLATGTWTHDYPIMVDEVRSLGLNVTTEVPEDVYKLMALYPQSQQRRPSVEYIPERRQPVQPQQNRGREAPQPRHQEA